MCDDAAAAEDPCRADRETTRPVLGWNESPAQHHPRGMIQEELPNGGGEPILAPTQRRAAAKSKPTQHSTTHTHTVHGADLVFKETVSRQTPSLHRRAHTHSRSQGMCGGDVRLITLKQACSWVNPGAQLAFKDLMIHGVLQFTLRIAVRCVLHRCKSQDIHC